MISRLLKTVLYAIGVFLFMLLALEISLRLVSSDPDYYWECRFSFSSPDAFQNRADGVWTYQPNRTIREAAVYFVPSLFPPQPSFVVAYDCLMKSNNLGLLQERDVATDRAWTVIIGDSFTAGQGGCPWSDRLQARRPDDNIVNAGLMGSGFIQWDLLLKYLRQQGLNIRRILVIATSNDPERLPFNWQPATLACVDHNVCPPVDKSGLWMQVRMDETHAELESRTRARFVNRFGHLTRRDLVKLYIKQNSYLYKFLVRAHQALQAMLRGAQKGKKTGRAALAGTDAALKSLKSLKVPVHVLMVSQRHEAGWLSGSADSRATEEALKANNIAYSWCRIPRSGFMSSDGHPTRAGYDKLVACADAALRGME